jgi:hypothetical protein
MHALQELLRASPPVHRAADTDHGQTKLFDCQETNGLEAPPRCHPNRWLQPLSNRCTSLDRSPIPRVVVLLQSIKFECSKQREGTNGLGPVVN